MKKSKSVILSIDKDFEEIERYNTKLLFNKEYNIELFNLSNYNEYRLMSHYCLDIAKSYIVRYVKSKARQESRKHRYNVKNTIKSIKVVIE